eukprot:scaffold183200_cov67-Attheya_sp.AAC.2
MISEGVRVVLLVVKATTVNKKGWRLPTSTMLTWDESEDWIEISSEAMQELCSTDKPPVKYIQCRTQGRAYYVFGDASKPSFGATIQIGDKLEFEYRRQWTTDASETMSSNWRELNNLVEALE